MLEKDFVSSGIPYYPERLVEADKKWNEGQVYIGQEWILEVDLKKRGVQVPALDLRFPKQQGKNAYSDEYNYYLKEDCRASFHSRSLCLIHIATLLHAFIV